MSEVDGGRPLVAYSTFREVIATEPDGPLSKAVPSSSMVATKKEVKQVLDEHKGKDTRILSKCGKYESFTLEEKAQIGKQAAEYSVTAMVRHFSRVFTHRSLKESTVRTWKMKYLQEVAARRRANDLCPTVKAQFH